MKQVTMFSTRMSLWNWPHAVTCMLILLAFLTPEITLSQDVIIGSGTGTNSSSQASPVNIYYRRTNFQIVYTAAEINSAGAQGPCAITDMGWFVSQAPIYNLPDYQIKLKHVTVSDASSDLGSGGWTTVKNPFNYAPTTGGADLLQLDQSFSWNGVDNIGVEVCWSQVSPTWNSSGQVLVTPASNGSRYIRTDAAGNSCGASTALTLGSKPNVHFVFSGCSVTNNNDPIVVPSSGNETVACGTDVSIIDNGQSGNYVNNSSGYIVLESNGDAQVTIAGTYNVEYNYDYIRIFDGNGILGSQLTSFTGSGSINYTGSPGQTLTLQLTSDGSVTSSGFECNVSYSGDCNAIADPCAEATLLTCESVHFGNTLGQATLAEAVCGTSAGSGGVVWHKIVGTGGSITANLCNAGTTYDTKLWVYEGACGNLTCVGGNDDTCGLQSQVSFDTQTGTDYYIVVGGYGSAEGYYELNFTCSGSPCESADTISCGDVVSGNTVGLGANNESFCITSLGTGGAKWYTLEGTGDNFTVSTCDVGTTYDTKIWVYEGACGALNCVDGNDDSCGLQSSVSFSTVAGSSYYVVIGGYGAAEGDFVLHVDCVIEGCIDVNASNYNAAANTDDGSCVYNWYTVEDGNASGAIWHTDPFATVGMSAVFGDQSNFFVVNGNSVVFDASFTCHDLTIQDSNGAPTVTFSGNETIDLYGDFEQSGGQINHGNGTLSFVGSSTQSVLAVDTLNNVSVNNPGGLSAISSLMVHGNLALNSGDFNTMGNSFILVSDETKTGSIGIIASGSFFTGSVTLERYIPAGNQNWVNLCNPLSGNTLQAWDDDIFTTGFPGSQFPNYDFVNIQSYDETITGGLNDGWTSPTDITNALSQQMGYMVYMTSGNQVIDVSGQIQQGNVSVPLTHNSTGVLANDGWQLVANPYPSEIDFELLYDASSGIGATCYIYDAENGSYKTYTAGVGVGSGNGFIPSSQSFWVQVVAPNASLNWEETHKSNTNGQFERSSNDWPEIELSISSNSQKESSWILFDAQSIPAVEPGKDAFHLGGFSTSAPEISWVAESGELLTVNRTSSDFEMLEVPVHLKIKQAGTYEFTIENVVSLPEFSCLYLEDLESGDFFGVSEGEVIELTFDQAFTGERFLLHLTNPVALSTFSPQCFDSNDGSIDVNVANDVVDITISNDEGIVFNQESVVGGTTVAELQAGFYVVTAISSNGLCPPLVTEVSINAPEPPQYGVLSMVPECNIDGGGAIEIQISGAGNFNVILENEDDEVLATWSDEEGNFGTTGLNAGTYTAFIESQCDTEAIEVDLTDQYAVQVNAAYNQTVTMVNDIAFLQAQALLQNADTYKWYVNGVNAGDNSDLYLPVSTTGDYVVELEAANESCIKSISFEIEVVTATGVAEIGHQELEAYLANDQLFVQLPEMSTSAHLSMMDASGRIVLQHLLTSGPSRTESLGLPMLAAGVYIVRVRSAKGEYAVNLHYTSH